MAASRSTRPYIGAVTKVSNGPNSPKLATGRLGPLRGRLRRPRSDTCGPGSARPQNQLRLELDLLRDAEGVIHLDPEIANRARAVLHRGVRNNYATSLGIYLVQRIRRIQTGAKKTAPEPRVAACFACRLGSESFQNGCGVAGDIGRAQIGGLLDRTTLCLHQEGTLMPICR
jgi:hypothetical protein